MITILIDKSLRKSMIDKKMKKRKLGFQEYIEALP